MSAAEAPYFDENHPFVATCICICLLGHVFTCFPVGVACGVVAVARAMWLVQCAASAQTICHMCAANKTYRCDSRTLWQHHVAMALPLSFLWLVYVLAFKKHMNGFKYASCLRAHMQSCIPCVRMPLRPSHNGTHEAGCWCTSVGFSGTGA